MKKLFGLLIILIAFTSFGYEFPKYQLRGMNIIFSCVTEADVAALANEWKANSARLMIHQYDAEKNMNRINEIVDWCKKYNLYCVINLVPSSTWEENFGGFWQSAEMQANYIDYCKRVVAPLAASGEGIAWDIFNEPHACSGQDWTIYSKKLTAAFRELDKVHPLVVEAYQYGVLESFYGPMYGKQEPTGDPNTVYSFHTYQPNDYTFQLQASPVEYRIGIADQIRRRVKFAVDSFAVKYNVRLWAGEFGCNWWAPQAARYLEDNIRAYEEAGIGWCGYAFREKNFPAMNYENSPEIAAMFKRRMVATTPGITLRPMWSSTKGMYRQTASVAVYDILGRMVWKSPGPTNSGHANTIVLHKNKAFFSAQ